jgi:hypothetical protein
MLHLYLKTMNTKRFLGLGGLLLAHPATAQLAPIVLPPSSQGMFTGISLGMQLEDSTGTRLRFRTPGTTTGSNLAWDPAVFGPPSPQHPDYSNAALFSRWTPFISGQGSAPVWSAINPEHNPVFGDMSTGGDLTPPVDINGTMDMFGGPNTAWYSLSFTVEAGTDGIPGSVFGQVAQAAGHVFSYTVPLSTDIRPELVNTVRFEYTRSQLGLAGSNSEITALDWGMGVIATGATGSPGTLQPIRDRLYFSLDRTWWVTFGSTPAAVGRDNKSVQVPGEAPFELDPSVVYRMDWLNGTWSIPVVAFGQADLYGQPQVIGSTFGPAIDALSVDEPSLWANSWRTVFSLDSTSTISDGPPPAEVLVSQKNSYSFPNVTALPLSARTTASGPGIPIDNLIGIGPDEITGLCGRDPNETGLLDQIVGIPLPLVKDPNTKLSPIGLSLQRFDAPVDGKSGLTYPALLIEVHGIQIPANRSGWLVFEAEAFDSPPYQPIVLPITFTPQLLPGSYVLAPGTETRSLVMPALDKIDHQLRLRANLFIVGGPTVELQQSWVSVYSM